MNNMITKHIEPSNDLFSHIIDEDITCPCDPYITDAPNGTRVVIHYAWDCREYLEKGQNILTVFL